MKVFFFLLFLASGIVVYFRNKNANKKGKSLWSDNRVWLASLIGIMSFIGFIGSFSPSSHKSPKSVAYLAVNHQKKISDFKKDEDIKASKSIFDDHGHTSFDLKVHSHAKVRLDNDGTELSGKTFWHDEDATLHKIGTNHYRVDMQYTPKYDGDSRGESSSNPKDDKGGFSEQIVVTQKGHRKNQVDLEVQDNKSEDKAYQQKLDNEVKQDDQKAKAKKAAKKAKFENDHPALESILDISSLHDMDNEKLMSTDGYKVKGTVEGWVESSLNYQVFFKVPGSDYLFMAEVSDKYGDTHINKGASITIYGRGLDNTREITRGAIEYGTMSPSNYEDPVIGVEQVDKVKSHLN